MESGSSKSGATVPTTGSFPISVLAFLLCPEQRKSSVRCPSNFKRAGEIDVRDAGRSGLDAADAMEMLAATLEFSFDLLQILRRDDENHADAQVEGFQELIGWDISDFREIPEDWQHGPGAEFDDGVDVARE